ncbi:MAG: Tad domain-containing protein [Candidatus Obscuribacterales bacterium]|nr:Tad domain-containing protein [Candidatus Obscuribacterales bacterium]
MDNLLISKKSKRKKRGGSLTLVVAIGLGIVIVVLFLAVIYSQQFTHQKEAQTAIDSAAISVAKELSRISVQQTASKQALGVGEVAVCDQFRANGLQQSPVYGINTLIGRARLDAVIAAQLQNEDMKLLANRDQQQVMQAAQALRDRFKAIEAADYVISSPTPIDLKKIAMDAYNNNPTRAQNSPNISRSDVKITFGYIGNEASGVTDIPIPSPANMSLGADSDNNSGLIDQQRFYRAGVNVPVPNFPGSYIFNAISRQPKLVDRTAFTKDAPNNFMVPTVVRVEIDQTIDRTSPSKGDLSARKTEVATATAGGERTPVTAGIFRLEFPQGLPADQTQGNHFENLLAIMNAGKGAWTGDGNFFTSNDGPFPGTTKGGAPSSISPATYPSDVSAGDDAALNPRGAANPSQLVSYYVYDWLRNDCLRPNIDSVIKALKAPLRTAPTQTADAQKTIFNEAGEFLVQKAFAQNRPGTADECKRIWGGIFALIPDSTKAMAKGSGDGRSLNNFDASPGTYVDQAYVFRMQGSTPQQLAFAPGQTLAIGLDELTGCPTTVDGNPIAEMLDFREDVNNTNGVAQNAYDAGKTVNDEASARVKVLIRELDAILAREEVFDVGPTLQVPHGVATATGLSGLLATDPRRAILLANRKAIVDNEETPKRAQIAEQNRLIARSGAVMNNAVEMIASVSGVSPYTGDTKGLINSFRAITSIGLDRVVPADPKSTAQPRQYKLAKAIDYWPPIRPTVAEIPTLQAEIRGQGPSGTGQLPIALGDKNWLGDPRLFTGDRRAVDVNGGTAEQVEIEPGKVAQILCPPSVRPSSQTRNIELVTVGDASLPRGQAVAGAIQFTVSGSLMINENKNAPTFTSFDFAAADAGTYKNAAASLKGFENSTGVNALLEGNSLYQALNVYRIKTNCDRDPDNGRFDVLWSVMAQNNSADTSNIAVDLRNNATPGNRLDCGRAVPNGDQQPVCDNEAVRIQFTSPLPHVPALKVLKPPPPPQNPANVPPINPVPPPPPPPPPPRSH